MMDITHYGMQAIDDMSVDDLRSALRAMIERYMDVTRQKLGGDLAQIDPVDDPEVLRQMLDAWFYGAGLK